ncbi:L-cystine transport system substrate-binding protein [Paenibacillus endophyticus]|uniref:L-cystine transport system substrate-binding protein n=1 Tax=Paenibacillus endophyticus TaxID=1294268 RepID=A0A7W5G8F8_9BACL|nr:transporter substrate-binding domain-containing protein [Paenibacillus endophyticus]MBB3151044.1 L-cystine transport system substrate-binding protein [Paenibacillus endophyticus]
MKKAFFLSIAIILTLTLAGCGSNKNNAGSEAASGNESKAVTKIVVGTGTQFPNVCFIDENGKLTGFDVELVREIDKRLADYEFDIQTLEFTNLLLSLETKKIDLVAHEMEKNPEREEKYLFNKEPYAHWRNKIIVAKDNDSVQTLDDLKGKKVLTTATSAQSTILENYNKENNNAIEIVYQNGGANDTVAQVTSGRVDAFLAADFTLSLVDTKQELKAVGPALSEADILFMFRKNDPDQQKLSDAVDGAIKELKADGTLAKLSSEWLGNDFTSEEK